MTQTDQELDRIERSIEIDATAERVWGLIERPGWWINEHDVDPDPTIREEADGLSVVVHPQWGEFRIQTLEADRPHHLSYKWIDNDHPDTGTLVQFSIAERTGGGVTLTVVESGFTSLKKDREAIARQVTENTDGWELELKAARRFVLGSSA